MSFAPVSESFPAHADNCSSSRSAPRGLQGPGGWGRIAWRLVAASLLCCPLLAGCVTTGLTSTISEKKPMPEIQVSSLAAAWENQVFSVPDPFHNGNPNPCLAGRVYLFGPEMGAPIEATGVLCVQLYAETPPEAGGQPVLLEQWNITPEMLKKLHSKDMVGWGYSLVLPWGTYNPNLTNIQMAVCYKPQHGMAIYDRSRLKLQPDRQFTITHGVQIGGPAGQGTVPQGAVPGPSGSMLPTSGGVLPQVNQRPGPGGAAPQQPSGMVSSRFTLRTPGSPGTFGPPPAQ